MSEIGLRGIPHSHRRKIQAQSHFSTMFITSSVHLPAASEKYLVRSHIDSGIDATFGLSNSLKSQSYPSI